MSVKGTEYMKTFGSTLLPSLAGTLAACIWGAWLPITKYSIINTLGIWDIIFLRYATASIIAIPIIFRYGFTINKNITGFPKTLLLAFCSGIGYLSLASLGFRVMPASYGSIIHISMTFFSIIIGACINRMFERKMLIGLVGILSGFFLFLNEISSNDVTWSPMGIASFVGAGCMFATYNVCAKRWNVAPLHAVSLVALYSFILFAPLYFLFVRSNIMNANIEEILLQIVYQGIIVSFVALLSFNYAGSKLGSSHASLFAVFTPVSAIFLSIVFLQETVSGVTILANAIMIFGMFIGLWKKRTIA